MALCGHGERLQLLVRGKDRGWLAAGDPCWGVGRLPLGAVSVHGGYGGQVPATVHRKGHTGCRRMPQRYSGTPSRHPQALA